MSSELRIVNGLIQALVVLGFPTLALGQLVLAASRATEWAACGAILPVDAALGASVVVAIVAIVATTRGLGETGNFHVARGAVVAAGILVLPSLAFALFLAVFSTWVAVFYVAVPVAMAVLLMLALRSRQTQSPWGRPNRTMTVIAVAVYGALVVALVVAASLSCSAMVGR